MYAIHNSDTSDQLDWLMKFVTEGNNRTPLRVVVLTSPPWGVLDASHDKALKPDEIKVRLRARMLLQ